MKLSRTPAGALIAKGRSKHNLTLKQVAQTLGVTVQFVNNMEAGVSPIPTKYVGALSNLLGVNPKTLATANFKSSAAYRKFALVVA